jgi:hypothetical protein
VLLLRTAAAGGAVAASVVRPSVATARPAWPAVSAHTASVPAAWFELALELVRATPGFSPPVASRAFGYIGVTLYEALVPGMPGRRSLVCLLGGLSGVPPPSGRAYDWSTVANSALAAIVRSLFPTAPPEAAAAIEDLDRRFATTAQTVLSRGVYERSAARGAQVARHVFEWSASDGGHEAFLRSFPPYAPPGGRGRWVPTPPGFLPALQPFWGTNRPFLPRTCEACSAGPPPRYSEERDSAFYAEGYECYRVVTNLTPKQKEIARFWSDDPGQTPTPPGHSISILNQVVRSLDVRLDAAARAYAAVGIAVADAFIACWRTKYHHNLLRPVTYIGSVIDPEWTPLLVTPPFPEYTSGHSVQSRAAAEVLTGLFGDIPFTDRTHQSRVVPARSFHSFTEAAEEAALSRLYGGIHFRAAIERGLEQGRCIGRLVSSLTQTGGAGGRPLTRHTAGCTVDDSDPSYASEVHDAVGSASPRSWERAGFW